MRRLRIMILIFFIAVAGIFAFTTVRERLTSDASAPVITAESETLTVSVDSTDEDLLSGMTATDNLDGDVTGTLTVVSKSKFITTGTLKVNYAAFDENNNVGVYSREVTYSDYISPRFSISEPLRFIDGDSNNDYLQNISVDDCLDGNITQKIRITFGETTTVDENVSSQSANLMVTNSAGDNAVLPITLQFDDYRSYSVQAPALTDYVMYVKAGTRPDLRSNVAGIWASGRVTEFRDSTAFSLSDVSINDSDVFYSSPGVYTAVYQLHRQERDGSRTRLGSNTLIIVVEE